MNEIDWMLTAAIATAIATVGMFIAVLLEKVIRPIGYWIWPEKRIASRARYRIKKEREEAWAEFEKEFPNIPSKDLIDVINRLLEEENQRRKP